MTRLEELRQLLSEAKELKQTMDTAIYESTGTMLDDIIKSTQSAIDEEPQG